ncbi:hypothetical protein [Clostridium estertheticum]|uniref:hypothetical protein n=1 Tax=Clostridium estertheticum TaxID=238834 RepID=UPI001C0C14D5|nr:hypothetical protein [Clostridium estertheticum]MBU3187784.1 hypothetical protein [Clostridium estertheticum]MCB2340226.1 hypothetical protein [Clostridium estertheticum]
MVIDYDYPDGIYIDIIEAFEKRKKIGTTIIKFLIKQNPGRTLCLYSITDEFWISLGFVADDDGIGTRMFFYNKN